MKSLVFGLVLVLAGCASQPGTPVVTETVFDSTLPEYAAWGFQGRVSLVRGEQGWHARMRWDETAGSFHLSLAGPFGQGAMQIDGDTDGMVRLQTADGQEYVARDADALVMSATGWQLPVTGLRYWVRGVPAPGGEARFTTSTQGRLERLQQDGWDISYNRYQALAGRDWPTRIHLETTDIAVTLVVDEWNITAPAVPPAPDPEP